MHPFGGSLILISRRDKIARWLELLALFEFDIVHRPGRGHLNADSLSRGGSWCRNRVRTTKKRGTANRGLA